MLYYDDANIRARCCTMMMPTYMHGVVRARYYDDTNIHARCCAGENLVMAVSGDPKFPHACFKCTMCDCYFNDDYATKAHVKGRRHRLNYKKTYEPSLYVEPTKAQVSEWVMQAPCRMSVA